MIIWSGRGILSVFIVLVFAVLFTILFALIVPPQYGIQGLAIGLVIGGWLTWYLGTRWNAEQIFYVEKEDQLYRSVNNHTLFWIPMQYIGLIAVVIGIFASLFNHIVIGIGMAVLAFVLIRFKWLKASMSKNTPTHQVTKESKVSPIEEQQKESSPSWERRPDAEDPNRFMPK